MAEALAGRRILITGAAVRIGRAAALRLAADGADVILHCNRSMDAARLLLAELGGEDAGHGLVQCDLADESAVDALLERLPPGPPLWGLVNNASAYTRKPMAKIGWDDLRTDFAVNAFAPIRLMCEFRNRVGVGCVVNLLDQRVSAVDPGAGSYGLAKKTLRDATEAAALEWAPDIRVNGIAPGYVLPPPGVGEEAMKPLLETVPMRARTKPEEVADACHYLMTAPTMTGQILYLDGGMHVQGVQPPERTQADYTPTTGEQ